MSNKTKISKEDMKRWLDQLVDDVENMRNHKDFNDEIKAYEPNEYVLMWGGEKAAEIMGIPYKTTTINGKTYRVSFRYRGIKFIGFFDQEE